MVPSPNCSCRTRTPRFNSARGASACFAALIAEGSNDTGASLKKLKTEPVDELFFCGAGEAKRAGEAAGAPLNFGRSRQDGCGDEYRDPGSRTSSRTASGISVR